MDVCLDDDTSDDPRKSPYESNDHNCDVRQEITVHAHHGLLTRCERHDVLLHPRARDHGSSSSEVWQTDVEGTPRAVTECC